MIRNVPRTDILNTQDGIGATGMKGVIHCNLKFLFALACGKLDGFCNSTDFVFEIVLEYICYVEFVRGEGRVLTFFAYSSQRGVTCLQAH